MEVAGVEGILRAARLASMPVMDAVGLRLSGESALSGARVFARMHVTRETASLLHVLKRAGAAVLLTASNPSTTEDAVREWLRSVGVEVETAETEDALRAGLTRFRPDLLIDNGEAIAVLHDGAFDWRVVGATVHSTNAEMVVRDVEAGLRFPVISVAAAGLKRSLETRHGVGQSVVQALLNATGMQISSRRVTVIGYGNAGSGLADYLRGMRANVTVVETSAVRALAAAFEGFSVATLEEALASADVVVTATSADNVIGREHLALLRDGVVLGSVGHHPSEIDVQAIAVEADEREAMDGCLERFVVGGKRIFLLGGGHQMNHVCGGGNSSEVMDLSLTLHALVLAEMWREPGHYTSDLHSVPAAYEEYVAETKLRSLGYSWAGAAA